MNVGSLVVNVGSLAVAFLSVYLSYKFGHLPIGSCYIRSSLRVTW